MCAKLFKTISTVFLYNINIVIPNDIPGSLPTKWWTPRQDVQLIIGSGKHGIGNREAMRLDGEFSFAKKCLENVETKRYRKEQKTLYNIDYQLYISRPIICVSVKHGLHI